MHCIENVQTGAYIPLEEIFQQVEDGMNHSQCIDRRKKASMECSSLHSPSCDNLIKRFEVSVNQKTKQNILQCLIRQGEAHV